MSRSRRRAYVTLDRTEQLLLREGLREVLLGSNHASACTVEQAVLARQHDHRRRPEHLVVLDQRTRLIAVEPGHHDVYEDDVRPMVGDLRQRVEPVFGGEDLAAFFRPVSYTHLRAHE